MASSRRTYDTDSITLRTVFAKNPGNSNVPALRALTADGAGGTYWAVPSSLGMNPSFNEIITSAGTYTADLSYNKFRLLAGENIGMVNGPAGSNQTTLFAKAFSQFDISGENTILAFSGNQLDPSVLFAGENGIVLRADPGTNTFFIGGTGASNTTISTGIYGFSQVKVTASASTITSSLQSWSGDFLTATSPSSLLRFIGYDDIQLSTNVTTNSIFFTISTFTSQGYLNISNAAFSAYPSTLSTVSSLYVTSSLFGSTIAYFSTTSGADYSTIQSSIKGLAISTGFEILTLQGLVNARATIVQLNNEIANVNSNLISTVTGLGSAGYISTAGGGSGDVTKADLLSTVAGLGTANYVSTLSLYSTLSTFSTALGSIGSGDVSRQNLTSTVAGLGTSGYISSLSSLTISTLFNTGSISTYSLEVYGSNTLTNSGSTIFRGATYLLGPLYVGSTVTGEAGTIINAENLVSTTYGLQTSGFLSTSVLVSTVAGLGTSGYVSSPNSLFLSTGNIKAGNIEISTVTFKDVANGQLRILNSSNNALYFNGSAVGSGNVINNFNTSSYIYQVSSVSTIFAYDSVVISSATNVFLSPQYFSSIFFSTGAIQTSSIQFVDTQTNTIQLLAVKNSVLQLNGSPIQGDVTVVDLRSTIVNLGTSGYVSTLSLVSTTYGLQTSGFLSTPSLISTTTGLQRSLVSTTYGLQTSGFLSTPSLVSTTYGLQTSGYLSTPSLISTTYGLQTSGFLSTPSLISTTYGLQTSGFLSSPNLTSTVAGLSNIVVTKLIAGSNITLTPSGGQGQVTIDAISGGGGEVTTLNLVSTTYGLQTSGFLSTPSLISTTYGLQTSGFLSSPNLTSTVAGLSNIVVTKLIAGSNITLTPSGGQGQVIIDAISGGGGGEVTTANLISTVQGLGNSDYISSLSLQSTTQNYFTCFSTNAIVFSSASMNYQVTTSTNTLTQQPNIWMNNRIYGSYNPITVVVSTLSNADPSIYENDIGKYFLYTNTCNVTIQLPVADASLNGWNVVIKNMPGSAQNFTVNTTTPAVIAPGVTTTVVCDGISFYSL